MNEIVTRGEGFYVSYSQKRPDLSKDIDDLLALFGRPTPKDLPETALCVEDTDRTFGRAFYILYGDHREAYKRLLPKGLEACMQYFLENIEQIAHSSCLPKVTKQ